YRRSQTRRYRSQLSRHRRAAADFRPHGEKSRFRCLRDVELRGLQPARRRPQRDGCAAGVSLPRLPPWFHHLNRKAVKTPKDLEGKRIGVPLYTQTAAVFIRGLLQDEYGVDLSGVHWVQGATNSPHSHGNPSAPPLIKPVSIEQNASGHSLS